MDYHNIPSAFFTYPEAASVGLTEKQAEEQKYPVKSSSFLFRQLGKSQAMGEIAGLVKIVSDKENKKNSWCPYCRPSCNRFDCRGRTGIKIGCHG